MCEGNSLHRLKKSCQAWKEGGGGGVPTESISCPGGGGGGLGITITENMDWGQHISDISSKATKTLGFLRRNLAFSPMSTKEVAYKTLVRPKLEYAAPI